jgi:signal peptidase I
MDTEREADLEARPRDVAASGHQHARESPGDGLLQAVQSMLELTVVALFLVTFTFQPFRIPSASMEPTLLVGDFLLVDKQVESDAGDGLLPPTSLRRGDVIVFHDPVDPSMHLVKRIVALPGDRIRMRGGHVVLNGRLLEEPYAVYRGDLPDMYRDNFPNVSAPDPEVDAHWWMRLRTLVDHGDVVIPANSFFVLGDNRNDSADSRYWGLVPRSAVVGRPFLIYLSLRLRDNDPASESGPAGWAQAKTRVSPAARLPENWAMLDFARWDRTLTVVR